MIVRRSDFESVVSRLSAPGLYGLDTETTGLTRKDRLFSIILSDEEQAYYFNFNDRPDHLGKKPPEDWILPREWIKKLAAIVENPESTFAIHNAKFDMSMLSREGLSIEGTVHCTEAMARVHYNLHMRYKLADCAKRNLGLEKDTEVDAYLKKHKLTSKLKVPGKDKLVDLKHFDKVPFDIMAKYAQTDAVLHRKLAVFQMEEFARMDREAPRGAPMLAPLVANERKLTKACHRIQEWGVRINRAYTEGALTYTQQVATSAMQSFEAMTGLPFEDSSVVLKQAFDKMGIELPKTATGKPSTAKDVLDALENPLADKIREIRGYKKLCSTYYSSFLYFADEFDILRAGMRQGGTDTHRFSYGDPNLQNLPKEDDEEDKSKPFLVRRCFIPRDGFCLAPIDFEQQEFKMMLDYANEREMIDAIMAGMDVHQATAELLGISRKHAKTLNFGLLYGMGGDKLAKALKLPIGDAYEIRAKYFSKLPGVKRFIRNVMNVGQARGYVWNWAGYRCNMRTPEMAYVLPNHVIQGGGAEVLRIAMVKIDAYIIANGLRSRMLAQVHDELLFEMHKDELHHLREFKKIMEGSYVPRNGLALTCSVEHSWKSWAKWDQVKGYPDEQPGQI